MASNSDGNNSNIDILRCICEKLVEYKKSLLQQLLDEQKTILVAGREHALNKVKEGVDNSVAKQESVPYEGEKFRPGEKDGTVAGTVKSVNSNMHRVNRLSTVKNSAIANEREELLYEKTSKDGVLKKRRVMEIGMKGAGEAESDRVPVKKTKRIKTKSEEKSVDRKEHTDVQEEKLKSAMEAAAGQANLLERTPYRVVRTSIPPRKYLMQKRREEEALDCEVMSKQQPILPASSEASKGVTCSNQSVSSNNRRSSVSLDMTTGEFEGRLRDYVRVRGELYTLRRQSVTRKRQLPQLSTPARCKSHWDFLLDEMKWMATDFAQERNWKVILQHRLAADVIIAQNSGSVCQELENRQIARGVALQISAFWRTMERIAARSRVRFESAGTDRSNYGDIDRRASEGLVENLDNGIKQSTSEDVEIGGTDNDTLALKYRTTGTAACNVAGLRSDGKGSSRPETMLSYAKDHVNYIVSAGKRARSAMTCLSTKGSNVERLTAWSLREVAFQELQARCAALQAGGGPAIVLATFQQLALRWMLDLYLSGLNMFLNDQLGMGKAATIVAFLSLIEIVAIRARRHEGGAIVTSMPESACMKLLNGPHLIVVSGEELHKWRHYLRIWHPNRRIQLYDAVGKTLRYKDQLQREWNSKLRAQGLKDQAGFLVVPPDDDDDKEFDDIERAEPIYCVLCAVDAFVEDRQAFVAFTNWQMVIVENEHGGHFDDFACISALQQIRQRQRRVLCNGQSIENWKSTAVRLQYAEFTVGKARLFEYSNGQESCQHREETWLVQELQVKRSSVSEVMQIYGKSSSARAALWKASSQQEDLPKYMNAYLLALSCLSLRRVRSEVETELRKIEEISLSCQLSLSQSTQYRNALSGFAATLDAVSGREDRLAVWLQLLLRLRQICNCVDLVNDMDKLGHADMRLITSCSAKLEALEPLLRRLVLQEGKKVVIYCQYHGMFPVLELFLSLLDISYVCITGSIAMQRRALCHFADRTVVHVALASTRLSTSNGSRAVSVFGSEAVVVVDSDWNATCDAKLRASWANMAAGGADTLSVYRLHCENTVESSLLRVGASLTEKVFGEITPQELFAVPNDMVLAIEKYCWWSPTVTSSSGNGLAIGSMARLASIAQQVERNEKYCGASSELEAPLVVYNVDLDAEEHLLLANTDELTPVEWYAVNYVHGIIDKKQQQEREAKIFASDRKSVKDKNSSYRDEKNASLQSEQRSFEKSAALDINRYWQEGDTASQLFFSLESHIHGAVYKAALENFCMQMRAQGMETHFDVYTPLQLRSLNDAKTQRGALSSETGMTVDTQLTYRISYRVSAPPPPIPPAGKSKVDNHIGQHGDSSKLIKSSKKQRVSATVMAAARGGLVLGSTSMNFPASPADMKRKLESQLSDIKLGPQKEQRVDLEGIPVPDVSEFADDEFWGDTNLDALDSAEWDDPALLGGILGVGSTSTGALSTVPLSCTASNATGVSVALLPSGVAGGTAGAHADSSHSKTPFQKSSKKLKTGTGRGRKSSVYSSDSGRDVWTDHSDVVLKKLFELYGANWTLIAQVLNSTTAVSRFVCKKRSPRQCYDRYGKMISGGLALASAAATSKDYKSSIVLEKPRGASVAVDKVTLGMVDTRIGLAYDEMLVKFPQHHSFPGLPPPSIVGAPSLVEAHRQRETTIDAAGEELTHTNAERLDGLKSIKTSFDAIIQCMKHKTSPPPIPIPSGAGFTASGTTSTPAASRSTDLGTKASLTAASFPSSHAPASSSAPFSVTKVSAKAVKNATVPLTAGSMSMTTAVPQPHKSYTDMISLFPRAALSPDEVIKRSKNVAMLAVQAAATVASVGRESSPLSASGDVMLGAGSGFGVSVNSSEPRRLHTASLTGEMNTTSVVSVSTMPSTGMADGGTIAPAAPATAQPQTTTVGITGVWGGAVHGVSANGLSISASVDLASSVSGNEAQRNAPIPVTTSTLLHVLDRMPEIKNKIQSILNRTDCSESQKVAMIARLLSNTNAINNTNALGTSATMPQSDASSADSSAMLSALTAGPGMLRSSDMLINTETPIPMPASLGAPPPNVGTSSSVLTLHEEELEPPTK